MDRWPARGAMVALAGLLTLTACASGHAGGHSGGHQASPVSAPAAAGARYLAIAEPANDRLEDAFDALDGADRNDLARARADFAAAAATERSFDTQLAALSLSGAAGATATKLIAVNEPRAALTEQAARAGDLAAVASYEQQLEAANASVETQVRALRTELGLPPPDTS